MSSDSAMTQKGKQKKSYTVYKNLTACKVRLSLKSSKKTWNKDGYHLKKIKMCV